MKIRSIYISAAVILLASGVTSSNATTTPPAPSTKTAPVLPPKADKYEAILGKMSNGQEKQVTPADLREAIQEAKQTHTETTQHAAKSPHPGAAAKAQEHLDEVQGHLNEAEKEISELETAKTEGDKIKAKEHAVLHIGFAKMQVDAAHEAAKDPTSPLAQAASQAAKIATTQAKQVVQQRTQEKAKKQ
jgi:hypothetical protein